MSKILDEVLAANCAYAADFGDKASLPMAPGRQFAILTCMDARLDPAKHAGLAEGDANIIRNAGGRASDDAIRSLVISCKASRHKRVVCHSPHGLRHGDLHGRNHARASRQQFENLERRCLRVA